jgi:alpha-glucosidase
LNLYGNNRGNQAAPLLLSTNGRFLWSEQPFQFSLSGNQLIVQSIDNISVERGGATLAEAYQQASKKYFPPSGKLPDTLLMSRPQYNTWIELTYNQNQEDILKYARAIVENGLPPGVLMIDDNWAPYYGNWTFRKDRFPDAKKMMDSLHGMGFKVMVWLCPFISPDTEQFRYLRQKRALLFDNKGDTSLRWKDAKEPLLINWWNGYSAELDFTNPEAVQWFSEQLQKLQTGFGVDGFKLDAGDMEYYPAHALSYRKATPNEQSELWGQFGLQFPLNEYRAMWKRGGEPLVERLRDKLHTWEDLQKLVPNLVAAGLLGYAFACPDMIGGGDFVSFIGRDKLDEDLVVRSAQVHALMPMMQFSAAPWRVLDSSRFAAVKKAVALRMRFTPYIMQLANEAAINGAPIARSMEYVFPHQGFERTKDQFMLGDKIMVAPVMEKGTQRRVRFPKGRWKGEEGAVIKGPGVKTFSVPIDKLLWFERTGK